MLLSLLAMLRNEKKGGGVQTPAVPSAVQTVQNPQQPFKDAVTSLKDVALVKSKKHMDASLRTSWEGSDPDIVNFYLKFKKELDRRGFPMFAHCFVRTPQEQYQVWRTGNSKARPGTSPHNFGMAVDIIHTTRGWDLLTEEWGLLGTIGKEVARKMNLPITWGGDWGADWEAKPPRRGWDPAHWELRDWKKRSAQK